MPKKTDLEKERELRNQRRRKLRLEKHTGLDWVDPEEGAGAVRGQQAMWRAVILQMLEDAASESKKPADQYNKTMARNWLSGSHTDFYMVCDLAGFDSAYIRKHVKKALLNQCKWRVETPSKLRRHSKEIDLPHQETATATQDLTIETKCAGVMLPFPIHQRKSA